MKITQPLLRRISLYLLQPSPTPYAERLDIQPDSAHTLTQNVQQPAAEANLKSVAASSGSGSQAL